MAPGGGARRTGTTERWPRAAGRRSDSPGSGGSLAVPAALPRRGNGVPEPLAAVRRPRCGPGRRVGLHRARWVRSERRGGPAGKTQARDPKNTGSCRKDTGSTKDTGSLGQRHRLPKNRRSAHLRPPHAREPSHRRKRRRCSGLHARSGRVHLPEPRPAPFPGAPPRRTRRKSHNYNQIKELEHKNTGYRPKDTG